MAKRKKAAALFEVIHADKKLVPLRSNTGWSPRWSWWFNRRNDAATEPVMSAPQSPPPQDSATSARPSEPSRLWGFIPSIPRLGFAHDPDRQVMSFQFSYTAAGICAFALIVVLALMYVIGKVNARHPTPALAEHTTDELRNGPAQPDVLNVGGGDGPDVAMAAAPLPTAKTPQNNDAARKSQPPARPQATWTEPKPPTTLMETNEKRTVGMQYVLVQSYPPEEKALAEQTVKLLNNNGILCTLETGLSYAPRWYCIVGVTGFTRVRNSPEYDAYVAKITEVGETIKGQQKFFKKFENKPIKWHDSKAAGNG